MIMLAILIFWRFGLYLFTVQPIPANDAFIFDGGVIHWLQHGQYINPCIEQGYPISSHQVFSIYPPLYQLALLAWLPLFGTSAASTIALHLVLCALDAWLVISLVVRFFPNNPQHRWLVGLLLAVTFDDRPDDLAHVFGLLALGILMKWAHRGKSSWRFPLALTFALVAALFTSVVIGAMYCGAALLTAFVLWRNQNRKMFLAPFPCVVAAFVLIVAWIIHFHPLWWQGFLENGRKQSVVQGLHWPRLLDLMKLVRTVPLFVLSLALMPWMLLTRSSHPVGPWWCLTMGTWAMGIITLGLAMTWMAPDYGGYTVYLQVLVGAGMLEALAQRSRPLLKWSALALPVCVILVSFRAVGMSTWGVACAWSNGYFKTQEQLKTTLEPYTRSQSPVILSSAYLYEASQLGVQHPIHSDWYFDRADLSSNADVQGLIQLKPEMMVLTQFDYYRAFKSVLKKLETQSVKPAIFVKNLAVTPAPDSYVSLQRFVQHVSWAPVVVRLNWNSP